MHVRTPHQPSGRSTATESTSGRRPTQAERSARTRSALLESAARGLSRVGYSNLNWVREVGASAGQEPDPVAELIALARGHAVFCRRDVARVVMALRVEFSGQDHPVGHAIARISAGGAKRVARLVNAGRRMGTIPPGPPARAVALAFFGALEGTVIQVAGQAPDDEVLAARAVAGVLGLDPDAVPRATERRPDLGRRR